MLFIAFLLICLLSYYLYNQRKEVVNLCEEFESEILESYRKQVESEEKLKELQSYIKNDPRNNKQRVFDRVDNRIVVNFTNHYKELLKQEKIDLPEQEGKVLVFKKK